MKTDNQASFPCSHHVASSSTLSEQSQILDEDMLYLCPMHPQIEQRGAGSCSLCGMALEPKHIVSESNENPELVDFKKRFFWGALFTVPIMILNMSDHLFSEHFFISPSQAIGLQFLFSLPVLFGSGAPFFIRAYQALMHKQCNMFSLISLGTGVAFLYSTIGMLAPHRFPEALRNAEGLVPVYFESGAMIVVLVLLGQLLELKARERTGGAIQALLKLTPKTARVITEDGEHDRAVASLVVGDCLRILPGETLPIDGIVTEGSTYIDESMMTGESNPILKCVQDSVIGGTQNTQGSLIIRVTQVGSHTMLARMIAMVNEAQRSRAPIQRLTDTIAGWFVPIVIVISVLTFGMWAILGGPLGLQYGLVSAVSVLIIACPCALGLATPMSIMVGVGKGAQFGILIKDAEHLEMLDTVRTICLDKTGTLTAGQAKMDGIVLNHADWTADRWLKIAASLEQSSEHPLAQALLKAAQEQGVDLLAVQDFQAITGQGVQGVIQGETLFLGNESFMGSLGLQMQNLSDHADKERRSGATLIFLANASDVLGCVSVRDPIKASAAMAIQYLQKRNIQIVMLSGDHTLTAQSVAKQLNITRVHAEILPEEKSKIIQHYMQQGEIVAMVGDGMNDAPALSAATIGIAMGTGTDVAIASAGIVLVKGDLQRLVESMNLSRAVMRNIRQNLFLAFIYNIVSIPIAAGVFFPFLGWSFSPIVATVAMSLSSLTVIGNALRLNYVHIAFEDTASELK